MVKYVDNGIFCGWYFVTENCYFGDGTKITAERIEKEENRWHLETYVVIHLIHKNL